MREIVRVIEVPNALKNSPGTRYVARNDRKVPGSQLCRRRVAPVDDHLHLRRFAFGQILGIVLPDHHHHQRFARINRRRNLGRVLQCHHPIKDRALIDGADQLGALSGFGHVKQRIRSVVEIECGDVAKQNDVKDQRPHENHAARAILQRRQHLLVQQRAKTGAAVKHHAQWVRHFRNLF